MLLIPVVHPVPIPAVAAAMAFGNALHKIIRAERISHPSTRRHSGIILYLFYGKRIDFPRCLD
jgi:hypothetical protein